jgi:hypothetical protein
MGPYHARDGAVTDARVRGKPTARRAQVIFTAVPLTDTIIMPFFSPRTS